MRGKSQGGVRRHGRSAFHRQGGFLLAGFVLVMALAVVAVFRCAAPLRGAADGLVSATGLMPEPVRAELVLGSGQGAAAVAVPAAATPKQEEKLEQWREEGIRMAAELTGIPEAFFRWLQDKGVPVGEFMRFLMPFLEWLEMVEPHNGTNPSPQPRNQPRETAV